MWSIATCGGISFAFVRYSSGIILNTYSINTCVLLHYEHKEWLSLNMFVFANSVVFILFSEFIMSWIIMSQKNIMIKDMINSENNEKHDVTINLKLQRATRLQLAAPYVIQLLWRHFQVQNIEHRHSWNKYQHINIMLLSHSIITCTW